MRTTLLLLALSGCSWLAPDVVCPSDDGVLQQAEDPLTCVEAAEAERYVGLLGGRDLSRADRNLLLRDLAARYRSEPADVTDDLSRMAHIADELGGLTGLAAAESRSLRVWEALRDKGPLDKAAYPQAHRVLRTRIVPKAVDDEERLVFTEADIEGWISYASLCREAQEGGPLTLSIANREKLYVDLTERFESAPRTEQLAMVAMGPFWPRFTPRWKAATYEEQQSWIQAAPLPPPMTATSMGYAAAVFEGGFAEHATVFHDRMGPLRLAGADAGQE